MSEQLALLPDYGLAHLQLTLAALVLGAAISIPLGILVTRHRSFEGGVLGVASVIQTIPSLALLAIMVPVLGAVAAVLAGSGIHLRSIGYLPALIALTLYSILPILRNTVTGISGVDPALVEAADGVGMTPAERLRRVELPLAMPVVIAGVRTATVWVVGTATLSTPVGATSLGNFIFSGLQTRNEAAVWVGCLSAAALALFLDQLIRGLEVGLRERKRPLVVATTATLVALCVGTAGAYAAQQFAGGGTAVRIGSKTFTEQYILSDIIAGTVQAGAGVRTEAVQSLGSTVLFDALRQDEIDLYVDYSGTIWATVMKRPDLPEDRATVLADVRRFLREEDGVTVAAVLGFENTYALAMREAQAAELGVETISDLARVAPQLDIGGDYEFFEREEWKALVATYGLAFQGQRSMDSALMYQAVAVGDVDVVSAYSTDGRIAALDLRVLIDDRGVIPPYDAILLASPRIASEAPSVLDAVAGLDGAISAQRMREMNFEVDDGGRSPAEVAREFLR